VIERCAGVEVVALGQRADVVPGETLPVVLSVKSTVPIRWTAAAAQGTDVKIDAAVAAAGGSSHEMFIAVPKTARLTEPYWLREPHGTGMYVVDDPRLIGRPESPADLPVTFAISLNDQALTISDRIRFASSASDAVGVAGKDAHSAELRDVVIVPAVSLTFDSRVEILQPGSSRKVAVEIVARRPQLAGEVTLELPDGWKASGPQRYSLRDAGASAQVTFEITAPASASTGVVRAHTVIDGFDCHRSEVVVGYAHIPPQLLQPPATVKLVSVEVGTRGHAVGYIAGAGDDVPQALQQLGYTVTELQGNGLQPENLAKLDAIVLGVRAFNTRDDLRAALPSLFRYVENGGTVIAQYNRPGSNKTDGVAPYRLQVGDKRVTDETAAVTVLAPDHPALNTPNKITAADFEGWIQERGIYFPSEWDEHFVPLLAMNDPGEPPQKGSLLVARYGKGYYVYTGLVFFRELPAGVPGAYRLFANLVSLGK
jgi:hypothetical protein